MSKVQEAGVFAIQAHGDQRYGEKLYYHHLIMTVNNLTLFGYGGDEDLLCAGYLHDTVEDTEVTLEELREKFGERVAALVSAVSSEPGVNRKERNAKTYPKIRATPGALVLKLADRIANVEESIATDPGKLNMYRKEFSGFWAALYEETEDARLINMWNHLDALLGSTG